MPCRRIFVPLALIVLLLAGCGSENPATSRLKPGTAVIVKSWSDGVTVIKPPDGVPFSPESPAGKLPILMAGSRAEVIADESEQEGDYRPVKIRVLSYSGPLPDGGLTGLVCNIPRHEIRPADQHPE